MMNKNNKTNIIASLLMIFFMFLFLIISGRFIYIQATGEVSDVSLNEWANDKRETSIVLQADRGKILDQDGKTLAYNRPAYQVYAVVDPSYSKNSNEPKHVVDVEITAETLAPFLHMESEEIKELLEKAIENDKFQVEFRKNLSQQAMEELKALQMSGIYFIEDSIRYYPNGMFASHIIGFAQEDEETKEIKGVTGIEREKNKILGGTDGFLHYHRDQYD